MHMLAKKILKDFVEPRTEILLHPDKNKGLSMAELDNLYKMVCIAKDLLKIDLMMKELDMSDPERTNKYQHYSDPNAVNL